MSFADLGLIEPLVQSVSSEGYTQPTPIQSQAIPHVLAGRDLLACAQTGTGKTAAFALPILQRIDIQRQAAHPRSPRVVVISPTRELAAQIGQSFATYGRNLHFRHTVIFGGVGQRPQVRALDHGVHVLIATPGRMLDLMDQGHLRLDKLEIFVLDEADRMLDLGFLPDLKRIISHLPKQRQSLFFSATMPDSILGLANNLLNHPVRVSVTPPATTVELIVQQVLFVDHGNKRALLQKVLNGNACDRALVFTRTKHGADKVARQLNQNGVEADAIHGNKSQSARERTLARFKTGRLRVLVATDLAARGIDVEGISHVINYDLPQDPESYVHRIGRTGRAGASGTAITFCDAQEREGLRAIEKLIKRNITVDADHPYHASSRATPEDGHARATGKRRFRPKARQSGRPFSSGKRKARAYR